MPTRLCFVCPSRADDLHDESNEMRAFFSCFPLPTFSSHKLPPPRLSGGYLWHSSKQSFASRDPLPTPIVKIFILLKSRLLKLFLPFTPSSRSPPPPVCLLPTHLLPSLIARSN